MNKPKLEITKNYAIFEMHETNRPLKEKSVLLESLQKFGFMPSGAIHCKHNGNGKLKIVRGNHRFHYAQRLGLPIYYIVDDTNSEIFSLEGDNSQAWNSSDFLKARAKAGDKDCGRLVGFMEKHHIPIGPAASLMVGQVGYGGETLTRIKRGTFKVANMDFADNVVRVTDLGRDLGIKFATSAAFVHAVSLCLRIPEFDIDLFCDKLNKHCAIMKQRTKREDYLEEIESVYNHKSQLTRLPIKFRALEIARERQKTFGKHKESAREYSEN
jgi:hypothetical protein